MRAALSKRAGIASKGPHRALDTILADPPEIAAETLRGIRTVIGGILQVGVKHDVIAINPIHSISDIEGGPKRKAHPYEPERLLDFLRKLDFDKTAKKADLPDPIRFLFGTARFGEALAVRWCDCNLTDEPVWVVEPASGDRKRCRAVRGGSTATSLPSKARAGPARRAALTPRGGVFPSA